MRDTNNDVVRLWSRKLLARKNCVLFEKNHGNLLKNAPQQADNLDRGVGTGRGRESNYQPVGFVPCSAATKLVNDL